MAFSRRWGPTSDWPFRSETILVRRIVGLFPKKKKSHRSWCLASALFSSISKVNKNNGSITQRHHYEQTFGFPGLFGLHKHSNKSNRVRTASTLLPGRFGVDASPFANWEGRLDPIPTRYQVRWKGRNDGNKFYGQDRAPTKKQRKKYHRHLQSVQQEKEKHGKPGYKAGPRREWNQMVKDEILNGDDGDTNNPLLSEEYTMGDALLDDTIGNTIAAADTPEPAYFGHKHRKYFNAVADHMDDYRSYQKQQLLLLSNDGQQQHQPGQSTTSNTSNLPLPVVGLPSDEMIGKVVRAFRDKNGTRRKPVGIIAALSHVIQDLNVPLAALGEYTYTSLLTCCRTPSEARRILQMIREQGLPISAYSWSILTDVYAKSGDYQGCVEVQQEMLQAGVPPTLASFTSLLAACYKVCIDGRVAHAVRAKAASVGWKKWQELRIVGIEPDVMAYGAILRLKAAIGQPEVCVNLIEEMQRFGVAPTTLCFSSALRAVARSHATAIRYEKGHSRRNRRREFLTKHHGQLARHILILAESAGVEQDEGFVSALCLCAAAAGDAATAKAIYVASQIRRLDSLRSIGSNQHLAQLRGENVSIGTETIDLIPSRVERAAPDSLPTELTDMTDRDIIDDLDDLEYATSANQVDTERGVMSFGEREYGKDNRVLTAVLHACAQAVDKNGIGTMWQGRENKGYLCANSLRLIATPKVPVYYDNSIPGQKITDNLTWSGEHTDGYREGKRKSRKFEGVDVDDESGSTLDDLDEMFSSIYLDEDGRRKEEYRSPTHGEIWRMKYGDSWNATNMSDHVDDVRLLGGSIDNGTVKGVFQPNYGNYEIPLERETIITKPSVKSVPGETVEFENPKSELPRHGVSEDIRKKGMAPDMFFDYETMRWKTNDKITKTAFSTGTDMIDSGNSASDDSDNDSSISSSDPDSDAESLDYLEEDIYFDKKERQWKVASKSIIADGLVKPLSPLEKDEDTETLNIIKDAIGDDEAFALFFSELQREALDSGQDIVDEAEAQELFSLFRNDDTEMMIVDPDEDFSVSSTSSTVSVPMSIVRPLNVTLQTPQLYNEAIETRMVPSDEEMRQTESRVFSPVWSTAEDALEFNDAQMEEENKNIQLEVLRHLLPALPDSRLKKILRTFQKSLGDPQLIDLISIVRENLPDYITATWLKQMSALTAKYVIAKAENDNLVNVELLNNALELLTLSGSLERAATFHSSEFAKNSVEQTGYSDRLLLQMLLSNNRFSRALSFKEKIEASGRKLDLKSYGALIAYCSSRQQLGSAMMLLTECVSVHNSPPSEASLFKLRLLYRQTNMVATVELDSLIGPDPVEWIRHGETNLKREMSKRGRRDIQLARNQLVRM